MGYLHEIINWLISIVGNMGYVGIYILMFLESSFFPFPSEIVMIPAGYLASKGELNIYLVIFVGTIGSLSGAWFNYILATKFGRRFLIKFISQEKLDGLDKFFKQHGPISTFNGRLIPVIRQYISFPAGLTNMNKRKFTIYTTLGAGIWVSVLAMLGYFLGSNEELWKPYLQEITIITLFILFIITIIYYFFQKRKNVR